MRSTLIICFLFASIVHERSQAVRSGDFRPTPIPLNEWHHDRRDGRASTLHETIKTDAPPSVAVVPAHYWEDALRHSVYLTLVRDKIDQLIVKGDYISSDSKSDRHASKEIDDHDLWEKIKSAPFDRIEDDEPASAGDVTIMAKGRLLEENGGFRFTEDERAKEKCGHDGCMDEVKAIWSVKRVRQRDEETSPGKHHYELTFSVISQPPKKQRKPFESPMRTFTVRESTPAKIVDTPQEYRKYGQTQPQLPRVERAIWFHKNIVPTPHYQQRQTHNGLDRIFSSLFSDDDYDEPPQRYRNYYVPPVFPQYSKIGYVGASSEQHQQKKLMPFPYKPHTYKLSRPPLVAPPLSHGQHYYLDVDPVGVVNNPYSPQPTDHRYNIVPSKLLKTTRPAILPTPPSNIPSNIPKKNSTRDVSYEKVSDSVENITSKVGDFIPTSKNYSKTKPVPIKVSYFPEHVRPPIYNAPPGVFVTMDKKPFKPMPPLKLQHSSKPSNTKPFLDFRPSPQVLDMEYSEPDPLFNNAFRPITVNYSDNNTTERTQVSEKNKTHRKTNKNTNKKPPKKHEIIKTQRFTTTTPDIITAQSISEEENDTMQWIDVLGAFTKTTPMVSQKDKIKKNENITTSTTTTVATTTAKRRFLTTTEAVKTTTSTPRPKKRTRPPPKFVKTEKTKKHKRITTSTTKAPASKTNDHDLTPQASSAATSATKSHWEPKNKTTSTTTASTTTSTTPKPTTSTTQHTTTTTQKSTTETPTQVVSMRDKNKNRFRQSTLMHKGTSVNHDKWSAISPEKNKTASHMAHAHQPRRKGSNFQGYVSSTTQRYEKERESTYHEDLGTSLTSSSSTTEHSSVKLQEDTTVASESYDENDDQHDLSVESISKYTNMHEEIEDESEENSYEHEEQESRDHTEYLFPSITPTEDENEIRENIEPLSTEATVSTLPQSATTNKTKCKRKKHQNLTTEQPAKNSINFDEDFLTTASSSITSTESTVTKDFFDELFGFTYDDTTDKSKNSQSTSKPELQEEQSEHNEQFVEVDEDFEDFLDTLEKKHKDSDNEEEYEEDNESSIDEDESPFVNEELNVSGRETEDSSDYSEKPFSFLELMAMD